MSTESVPTSPAAANAVARKVCELVAKSLARDPAEVKLSACLMEDLGAESLDFLDIVFELERAFNIQITRGEMERAARGDMSEEEFAPNGTISEVGLRRLRELMPEVSHRIHAGLRPAQILSLFTVQTFVNLVNAKQQGRTA
jgi:acyl carrier protein